MGKFRRVIDTHTILDKRFVGIEIPWLASIDRYFKEGTTSAAQRFQRHGYDITSNATKVVPQFFRNNCSHSGLTPVFSTSASKHLTAETRNLFLRMHIAFAQYRYLSSYIKAQQLMRPADSLLNFSGRIAARKDEAQVTGSLRQGYK